MKKNSVKPIARVVATLMLATFALSEPAASMSVFAAQEEDGETSEEEDTSSAQIISSGITMSTDYPGTSAEAGDSLSFDLDFTNSGTGEILSLSTTELPEGFEGYFQGDSNSVSSVYVKNGESEDLLTYIVTIPETAENGTYDITLYADGSSNSAALTLNLTVSELDLGASTLTTDYLDQEGTSGSSFSYDATLANNSIGDQSFELAAEAPDGWVVSFTAEDGSTRVTSVDVEGLSSTTITIDVTAPESADAGSYTIPVTAVSESESLEMDLNVNVTGSYDLSLTTQNSTLSFDVKTNKETSVVLEVTNNGNMELTDINLTAETPTDWTVEFSESTIDTLEAGGTKQVTAYVTPSDAAISGDYVITMTAEAEETSYSATFRVTAETQTVWGIVGIVIIIVILICLWAVFKKFGRH